MSNKKGVTVVSVLIIIVVLSILAGAITISTSYIVNDTYKKEFIREYKLVQAATDDYVMRNSGIVDFEETMLDLNNVDSSDLAQFDGETIVDNKIEMYIIDLNEIGIENSTYGLGNNEKDVYLLSKATNIVYYKKGFISDGDIYYRNIED